jgi:hypothetical protein
MTRSVYTIDHRDLTIGVVADSELRAKQVAREIVDNLLLYGGQLPGKCRPPVPDDVEIIEMPSEQELENHPARRRAVLALRTLGDELERLPASHPRIRAMNRGLTWCRGESPRDFGATERDAWRSRPDSDARRFEGAVAFEVAYRRPTAVRVGDGEQLCCEKCGELVTADSSPGVWVHDPDALGDTPARVLNEDHAARPSEDKPQPSE